MSYCWSAWNKKQTKKQRFSSVTAFIIMISFCKAKTTGHTKFSHAESMHVVSWFRRFSLSYFAVSPFSSSGFSSVFILLCSGNKTDFYLYAQMLGRCNPMGFLYSFSCSLALSPSPSSSPMSFLYFFEHLKLRVNLFLHVANKPTRAYRVSSIVNYRLPCDLWLNCNDHNCSLWVTHP